MSFVRPHNNTRVTISPSDRSRLVGRLIPLAACLLSLCFESAGFEPLSTDLQAIVERQARDQHVCAVSYATVHAGKLSRFGGASGCDRMSVPTEDSVFQAASLSKPVFAYAVLKLAQEGSLSLDAPLVSYLPQGYLHIQNPFAFGRPPISDRVVAPELQAVTARMVLNHTSGLPNWSSEPLAFDFEPGTGWQYSGEGFMLLQRVVEALTNENLDDFMRKRFFDPLGMSNTAFRWKPQFANMVVPGMSSSGQPRHVDIPEAMAPLSLYTTANDYAKFLAALMTDPQILRLINEAPVSVLPKQGLGWGLGWGVERGEGETFIWQWGNNPGYRAFVMASTSSGDAVVMLTSSENGLAMAEPIVTAVLPGTHRAFKSYLVREGLSYFTCKNLNWCM
jgi:CubicO group peptidase (beta-lactamase class C family)